MCVCVWGEICALLAKGVSIEFSDDYIFIYWAFFMYFSNKCDIFMTSKLYSSSFWYNLIIDCIRQKKEKKLVNATIGKNRNKGIERRTRRRRKRVLVKVLTRINLLAIFLVKNSSCVLSHLCFELIMKVKICTEIEMENISLSILKLKEKQLFFLYF